MLLPTRFWSKVNKLGPEGFHSQTGANLGPCWSWIAGKFREGYGSFKLGGKVYHAYKLAYEEKNGAVKKGLELDHLCRNTACVNPVHLEPVTHKENSRRGSAGEVNGARHRAKTHCPKGHPYNKENTRVKLNGWRCCKECGKIADKIRWIVKKANRA